MMAPARNMYASATAVRDQGCASVDVWAPLLAAFASLRFTRMANTSRRSLFDSRCALSSKRDFFFCSFLIARVNSARSFPKALRRSRSAFKTELLAAVVTAARSSWASDDTICKRASLEAAPSPAAAVSPAAALTKPVGPIPSCAATLAAGDVGELDSAMESRGEARAEQTTLGKWTCAVPCSSRLAANG